jgi:hypothetical protein
MRKNPVLELSIVRAEQPTGVAAHVTVHSVDQQAVRHQPLTEPEGRGTEMLTTQFLDHRFEITLTVDQRKQDPEQFRRLALITQISPPGT